MRRASWFLIAGAIFLGVSLLMWQSGVTVQAQAQKQTTAKKAEKVKTSKSACEGYVGEQDRVLPVYLDPGSGGEPGVDPYTICIEKSKNEQIEWIWKPNPASPPDFAVVFAKSPFKQGYFHKGKPKSGPASAGKPGRSYKYSVAVEGYGVVDPDVIIR